LSRSGPIARPHRADALVCHVSEPLSSSLAPSWGAALSSRGDELSVIAAAVLGGTSRFGVIGTVIGALMIGLILMGQEFS
jgi:ABC-type xylose transport system permease subunit